MTTLETTATIIVDCLPGFKINDRGDNCVFLDCDYFNQVTDLNGWFYEIFGSIYEGYGCTTTTPQTTELFPSTAKTTIEATTSIIIDCWPGFRVNEQGVFLGCNYINRDNGWYGWYYESFYYIYERYGCSTTTPQTTELFPTTKMTTRAFVVDCLSGFIPRGHDCVFLGCDHIDQNSGLNGWYFDSYYFIYEMYGCTTPTPLTSGIFSTTTMTTPKTRTNFQSSYYFLYLRFNF
jgi:hypothetical protein